MIGYQVIAPKYLSPDSSILGKLARDWNSPQRTRRARVKEFTLSLSKSGILVYLTWHHIEELIRHENEKVALSRLEFLSEFPLVAWCTTYRRLTDIGGIMDLNAYEVEAYESGITRPERVIDFVRHRLIRLGTGKELVERNADNWLLVRPYLIERIKRERQIASITHRPVFPEAKDVTLEQALQQRLASETQTEARLGVIRKRVRAALHERADPKLQNLEATADAFVDLVRTDREMMKEGGINPYLVLLRECGLDIEKLSPEVKIDELASLAMLASKLKVILKYMGRTTTTYNILRDGLIPSFALSKELHARTGALPRAAGSDIADRYLACFALYIDFVQGDKRTTEFFRQIRKQRYAWAASLGETFSAGTVERFVTTVEGFA